MSPFAHASRELSRAECLALLATEPYGRLILVRGGLPTVVPVNFVLDGSGIVVRTSPGSPVASAPAATAVAFQADCIDRDTRSGWSVTVVGRARLPHDALEAERLAALPLHPWVAGDRDSYLVVELGVVSGRRIGGPEPRHVGAEHVGAEHVGAESEEQGLVPQGPSALTGHAEHA